MAGLAPLEPQLNEALHGCKMNKITLLAIGIMEIAYQLAYHKEVSTQQEIQRINTHHIILSLIQTFIEHMLCIIIILCFAPKREF